MATSEAKDTVLNCLYAAYSVEGFYNIEHDKIVVELSKPNQAGDIATNVAMVAAKYLDDTPIQIAEKIVLELERYFGEGSCKVAGPGFINITMDPIEWLTNLTQVMYEGTDYGSFTPIDDVPAVNVEYVSANPTGPLHIGHARGAIVGDVLTAIYKKVGYRTTSEYYVNDAGGQIDMLLDSVRAHTSVRYKHTLLFGVPDKYYNGQYIADAAFAWDNKDVNDSRTFREFVLEYMMGMIKKDLKKMGITHDIFTYESDIVNDGKVNGALMQLRENNDTYTGVLPPPTTKSDVEVEYIPRKQLLFKSTNYGDDVDRPLKKEDGSWTYFATDMGYHWDKIERGFDVIINIWGADHAGYVSRIAAVTNVFKKHSGQVFDAVLCQMVSLIDNGEKVKMSKRDGNVVSVSSVIDKVGKDAFRFNMLTRKANAQLDFDYQKVVEQSKDNMVYYVQYAHARANSILKKAPYRPEYEDVTDDILRRLTSDDEMNIVKQISIWRETLSVSLFKNEPHHVAYYLYDLASLFHSLQTKGKSDPSMRFIVEGDDDLAMARLILVQSVATVIKSGLDVLGVSAPETM